MSFLKIKFRKELFRNELYNSECFCYFCNIIERKVKDSLTIRKLIEESFPKCEPITYENVLKVTALAEFLNSGFHTSLQDLCIEFLLNEYPRIHNFIDSLEISNILKDQVKDYEAKIENDPTRPDLVFLGTFVLLLRHHVGDYLSVEKFAPDCN